MTPPEGPHQEPSPRFHQRVLVWAGWIACGVLAFGALLDAISNAQSLFSPLVAQVLSCVLLGSWALLELLRTKYSLNFGVEFRLKIVGVLIVLWIPVAADRLKPATIPVPAQKTVENDSSVGKVPSDIKDISELGGLNLEGYRIFQALNLNSFSNGIDGSILILIDKRLEGLQGGIKRDPYSAIDSLDVKSDPSASLLPQESVNEALMLIVDKRFRMLYSERLGRESARLDRVFLYQDRSKPTFVLTRDYSVEWGSYNGPISYFLEVSSRGIHYMLPHGLMTSLKSAWAILPTASAAEIVSKKCRPDLEKSATEPIEFKIIYERFTFDGGFWQKTLREQSGFWESTQPLDPKDFSR